MPLFRRFWKKQSGYESSGDECEDSSATDLSYVGMAAYDVLRKHHNHHHHELWNVTHGKLSKDRTSSTTTTSSGSGDDAFVKTLAGAPTPYLHMTPLDAFTRSETVDPPPGHDDWFPQRIGELIARTENWCDIMSLAPPDGQFLTAFQKALQDICAREVILGRITIRIMFGNVVGMPVNCTMLMDALTKDLPPNANQKIKLWVGSWRKGVSWNHAKLIAVDGHYLWTGGHNFWDGHYLQTNPTNDLSIEMEGGVAKDAHRFANAQWGYVVKKQSTAWGRFVDRRIPDALDVPRRARVTVSEFPESSTAEFPPYWKLQQKVGLRRAPKQIDPDMAPVITMGRYGVILKRARPSDDAFVAMFDSAQHIIRLALQDLGPPCIPNVKLTLPGMEWPKQYLRAMARALWTKGVDIEIILSNPNSIPGNLPQTEANYGMGWACVDVAAEIIKAVQSQFPDAQDAELRQMVQENLRVSYLRSPRGGTSYKDGGTLGLHSKHFIIDDICTYIGSQNLYMCDLAEWGVVIDSPDVVADIKSQYWDPMWKVSYTRDDCDVDKVMDGLKIDRGAASPMDMTKLQLQQAKARMSATMNMTGQSPFQTQAAADGTKTTTASVEESSSSSSESSAEPDGTTSETEEC